MTAGSFGARLRAERERRGIRLEAIAQATKISVAMFEALERDDLSRWPAGIFRRAFIRAYAQAIGLDPAPTVAEFLQHFPDPSIDATAANGGATGAAPAAPPPAPPGALRLTLADESPAADSARHVDAAASRQRVVAAACDLAAVTLVGAGVALAGGPWSAFTAAALSYFVGGQLTLGSSPGAWIAARAPRGIGPAFSPRSASATTTPTHPLPSPTPAAAAHRRRQLRGVSAGGALRTSSHYGVPHRKKRAASQA